MKKVRVILLLIIINLLFFGCKKSSSDSILFGTSKSYSNVTSAPPNSTGTFSFSKITITPNPVKIGVASKLYATASGNNLTYKWTTSHGDLFSTGSSIYYSDSCIGEYTVTCVVSDGTHSATITIPISVSN